MAQGYAKPTTTLPLPVFLSLVSSSLETPIIQSIAFGDQGTWFDHVYGFPIETEYARYSPFNNILFNGLDTERLSNWT
ncbi:unnamed protein product [Rhizoctonia solani]|uniref:Uncharacterized protein n=1 Tax=Rhizoctonia solani TaxID=456999 RepID=A0A8H3BP11_9AGAM|nr:unnamed protein product [Rhizoctonia solani]